MPRPPADEAELVARARALAGRTLAELAAPLGLEAPPDLRRRKGWVGQLLELVLGATASSRSAPDFEALGVELKTIPIGRRGQPRESTYVCVADLVDLEGIRWETSRVRHKLARVLWVPVQARPELTVAERRVGHPLLWSPDVDEEATLRADWEELTDLIRLGQVESISAEQGRWLQIRPKALSSKETCWAVGDTGEPIRTLPRGYYLRATFTGALLARHFVVRG